MMLLRILFYSCGIMIFISCNKIDKSVIYETEINNQKFRIERCLRKTYSSNYLYYRLLLDNSKPIEINTLDASFGLPYNSTIFNSSIIHYFDTTISYCEIENPDKLVEENSAYLNKGDYSDSEKVSIKNFIKEEVYKNVKTERKRFLIYLNPKEYSKTEFETIAQAISKNSYQIDTLLFACQPFNTFRKAYDGWQLSGIVYGNIDDFCETYTKSTEDYFKIYPDGQILHYNELSLPGKSWLSGQDYIYSRIIMPENKIKLKSYKLKDLISYKNSKGISITSNFKIVEDSIN